ncbi:MAG: 3-isopropylmalate dehydratase large subunit [Candidatus Omnitrophica bacterium CG11_big_fil_rev_8_21_14_0_20_42_13]|uniref:3-isopropylmalate dehydratase large subunit n=1 Tax=Candidatus Ghiorseimicrobium undicola TaxID=1974746 RepID=A0A2H0LVB9_9BACT|nr:MAG: 3-isopropylmalate dehydratase large subunit [Candidatus Omnitrophica bacterium CG11_big_fil_rev_8_21_14_0_20_42_13]
MNKTIIEKILSAHSGQDLKAGDFAVCNVDYCFGQDGTSSIIIDRIRELGVKRLANKDKFSMVIDHSSPSPNMGVSKVHKKMRDFANEFGLNLYDIGCGVCHEVIPFSGKILPGDLVLGADSHTCTYGAIGVASTGVGSTDLAIALASGKNWFRVPETIKIELSGKLPKSVFAKDIILYIIGDLTANGATYKAVEFYGEAIDSLDLDGRFTMSNMVVEMGAKCAFFPVDKKVLDWLKLKNSGRNPVIYKADAGARYSFVKRYDVSGMTPQVAKPHTVDNVFPVADVAGTHIDEAFLGTCTNGRLADLKIGAKILKDNKINPDVKFIVAPASKEIYLKALKLGLIKIFINANAAVISPGCGPCVGTHMGVPSDNETVISTANRNFKGRMGNPDAEIYLASPATVCASAINGKITDPGIYLEK